MPQLPAAPVLGAAAHDSIRELCSEGLPYYQKVRQRNWKNTVALGPEEACLHCEFPKDLEARSQAIWLAATPMGREFLRQELGLLVGLHCVRVAGDGTLSANVVAAPALWPQMYGRPKETTLTFTPGLTHSYLLDWPKGQAEPNPPLPDAEAAARLWSYAEAECAGALTFLQGVAGGEGATHQAPEELYNSVLILLGPDGFHQVVAEKLGTGFTLGADRRVSSTA